MSARDKIRSGLGAVPRGERRKRSLAAGFKPSPELERLADLRESDPEAYAGLSPGTKVQIGLYLGRKQAAEEVGA